MQYGLTGNNMCHNRKIGICFCHLLTKKKKTKMGVLCFLSSEKKKKKDDGSKVVKLLSFLLISKHIMLSI